MLPSDDEDRRWNDVTRSYHEALGALEHTLVWLTSPHLALQQAIEPNLKPERLPSELNRAEVCFRESRSLLPGTSEYDYWRLPARCNLARHARLLADARGFVTVELAGRIVALEPEIAQALAQVPPDEPPTDANALPEPFRTLMKRYADDIAESDLVDALDFDVWPDLEPGNDDLIELLAALRQPHELSLADVWLLRRAVRTHFLKYRYFVTGHDDDPSLADAIETARAGMDLARRALEESSELARGYEPRERIF